MAVDGVYKIEIDSPMGTQEVKLTFKTEGTTLNGSSKSVFGQTVFAGTVDGDNVAWNSQLKGPIGDIGLSFNGKIIGDDFTGEVNIGMFGTYPFKGKRI